MEMVVVGALVAEIQVWPSLLLFWFFISAVTGSYGPSHSGLSHLGSSTPPVPSSRRFVIRHLSSFRLSWITSYHKEDQ